MDCLRPLLIAFLFFVFSGNTAHSQQQVHQHYYCVVGAGPGGLQLAYFLHQKNRDYVVFERNAKAGSFFEKFPRHRKLISINKRHTGRSNKEFNLRHDWNSLLTDDLSLLFTSYSEEMFPNADLLYQYMQDYQKQTGVRVRFNTDIVHIASNASSETCLHKMRDQRGVEYCCKVAVIATGFWKLKKPNIKGGEHIEGYEEVKTDPRSFDGQSVLIIGLGNSAMEMAYSIYGAANYIHLVGRHRVRLSWDTHYVGDVRGVNNEVLDTYMLKSLDGLLYTEEGAHGLLNFDIDDFEVEKGRDGRLYLKTPRASINQLEQYPLRSGYHRIIRCMGFLWDPDIFDNATRPSSICHCPKTPKNKYPMIGADYQSPEYDDLYFAGTLVHSLDFRKSAGGFIHGFRYTDRVLFNLLEWKHEGNPWPSYQVPLHKLTATLLNRANEASGIYQMFSSFGDIVILDKQSGESTYLQEFPIKLLPELHRHSGHTFCPKRHLLVVLVMQFGANFSTPGQDSLGPDKAELRLKYAHLCKFLHPVVRVYSHMPTSKKFAMLQSDEVMPQPQGIHHIVEDFTTQYDGAATHYMPLRRFLEFFLDRDLRMHTYADCMQLALRAPTALLRMPYCQRYLWQTATAASHGFAAAHSM